MKSIYQLIPDIQHLVEKKDGWFTPELSKLFSEDVSRRLQRHFNEDKTTPTLRLSQMGPKCPCALWHSIYSPGEAEALPPWVEIKFAFGHILEALVVTLSKATGHEVTGEQDEVTVDGVKGHRDCVIDGCVVDIKSASSMSFKRFKDGSIKDNDSFGYLEQLDAYLVGSLDDPLVRVKDRAFDLVVDKQLGHMVLYEHKLRDDISAKVAAAKVIVASPRPPTCTCGEVPDGKSGNFKLDVRASYSPQKYLCKPNLRTFIYSDGPRYLTKVVRLPDVPEIRKPRKETKDVFRWNRQSLSYDSNINSAKDLYSTSST